MSATDKTRPWWVQLLDAPHLLVEHHDHTTGDCTLPPAPTEDTIGWRRHGCYWDASPAAWHTLPSCGCHLCTQHDERRAARRRDRHVWRTAARTRGPQGLDDYAN